MNDVRINMSHASVLFKMLRNGMKASSSLILFNYFFIFIIKMRGRELLKQWRDHCQCYRVLHKMASEVYKVSNARLRIPAIIITSVSAGLAFSVQVFPEQTTKYVPVFVGFLNLVAGTFTSISTFYKTAERSEGHTNAAVAFSKLKRKIQEKLLLVNKIQDDFIASIREDLDGLIESFPDIPEACIVSFKEKNPDTDISLPSIVHFGGFDQEDIENAQPAGLHRKNDSKVELDPLS